MAFYSRTLVFKCIFRLIKKSLIGTLWLIIGSGIFFIDVVLCEGSSDTAEGHKAQQGYGYKHLLIGLGVALISVWLIKYGITPGGTSSSGGGNTELIVYTPVDIPDLSSEEPRAALRALRESLNLIGDSLERKK